MSTQGQRDDQASVAQREQLWLAYLLLRFPKAPPSVMVSCYAGDADQTGPTTFLGIAHRLAHAAGDARFGLSICDLPEAKQATEFESHMGERQQRMLRKALIGMNENVYDADVTMSRRICTPYRLGRDDLTRASHQVAKASALKSGACLLISAEG